MRNSQRLNTLPRYCLGVGLFVVAILLAPFLGACENEIPNTAKGGQSGHDSARSDELVDELAPDGSLVIFWHTLTGADEDRLVEMIDDFNAGNDWDITVVGEYQGDPETVYEKVIAGLPTGQLPDLVMTDPSLTAAYASSEVVVALSPYLESENWGFTPSELDDFFPSALEADSLPQFNAEFFSVPLCRSLQLLYYNSDWLKELDYDTPPKTWGEFREMACAASEPIEGLFGFELGMDSSIFTSLLATQGAPLLNSRGTTYTLGGEQGRVALEFVQDLITDGCATWETNEGLLSDFSAGKILFAIDSTAAMSAYRSAIAESANFAWTLSVLPHTTDEPLVSVQGISLALLHSTDEEQLAAWLFVKWLAEPPQQAQWSQHTSCFPIRRSALEEMEVYLGERPQYRLASQLLEQKWVDEPSIAGYETCRAEIGRMLYAVTAGENLDQWLSDTQSQCNQALDSAPE